MQDMNIKHEKNSRNSLNWKHSFWTSRTMTHIADDAIAVSNENKCKHILFGIDHWMNAIYSPYIYIIINKMIIIN